MSQMFENIDAILKENDEDSLNTWIYPVNFPIRSYQYEISKTALHENTLVCLPTGLGKTFIAAVLMYNFYRWFPMGKVVFMAPTKPLVAQQIQACFKIMGIAQPHMKEMTGSMAPAKRKEAWDNHRVLFSTPQVLANDLSRGSIPIKSIKLVVFDEAHKALGEHAYCQVVRHLQQQNYCFRVLALSATPGSDVKAIQQVLQNLLISKIELRTENSPDVSPYTHDRVIEKLVISIGDQLEDIKRNYMQIVRPYVFKLIDNGVLYSRNEMTVTKFQLLKAREAFRQNPPSNISRQMTGLLEGTFALCMSLYHALELLLRHGGKSFCSFLSATIDNKGNNLPSARGELMKNDSFLKFLRDIQQKYGMKPPLIDATTNGGSIMTNPVISHPKMEKLLEIVLDHFRQARDENVSSRIMIFSQYRESVLEITELLQCQSLVKPMSFLGQSSGSRGSKAVTQKQQIQVVKEFKDGEYNTLVATCVGEEGLDIGEVDLIICYDAQKSPIRLVQRIGRTGRKRQGRIVVLVTEGQEHQTYNDSQYKSRYINEALQNGQRFAQHLCKNPSKFFAPGKEPSCLQLKMKIRDWMNAADKRKAASEIKMQAKLLAKEAKKKESLVKANESRTTEKSTSLGTNRKVKTRKKAVPIIQLSQNEEEISIVNEVVCDVNDPVLDNIIEDPPCIRDNFDNDDYFCDLFSKLVNVECPVTIASPPSTEPINSIFCLDRLYDELYWKDDIPDELKPLTPLMDYEETLVEVLKSPEFDNEELLMEVLKSPRYERQEGIVEVLKSPGFDNQERLADVLKSPEFDNEELLMEVLKSPEYENQEPLVEVLKAPGFDNQERLAEVFKSSGFDNDELLMEAMKSPRFDNQKSLVDDLNSPTVHNKQPRVEDLKSPTIHNQEPRVEDLKSPVFLSQRKRLLHKSVKTSTPKSHGNFTLDVTPIVKCVNASHMKSDSIKANFDLVDVFDSPVTCNKSINGPHSSIEKPVSEVSFKVPPVPERSSRVDESLLTVTQAIDFINESTLRVKPCNNTIFSHKKPSLKKPCNRKLSLQFSESMSESLISNFCEDDNIHTPIIEEHKTNRKLDQTLQEADEIDELLLNIDIENLEDKRKVPATSKKFQNSSLFETKKSEKSKHQNQISRNNETLNKKVTFACPNKSSDFFPDDEEDTIFSGLKKKVSQRRSLESQKLQSTQDCSIIRKPRKPLNIIYSDDDTDIDDFMHEKSDSSKNISDESVTLLTKCQDLKKKKKKATAAFVDLEADVSMLENVSTDENESGNDEYDESFVDDQTQIMGTQAKSDMQAVYLKSVRSPVAGKFLIKPVAKSCYTDSEDLSMDDESDDSFVVDNNCIEYETECHGESMLAEDPIIQKVLLKNCKKRKRIVMLSSDDEPSPKKQNCDNSVRGQSNEKVIGREPSVNTVHETEIKGSPVLKRSQKQNVNFSLLDDDDDDFCKSLGSRLKNDADVACKLPKKYSSFKNPVSVESTNIPSTSQNKFVNTTHAQPVEKIEMKPSTVKKVSSCHRNEMAKNIPSRSDHDATLTDTHVKPKEKTEINSNYKKPSSFHQNEVMSKVKETNAEDKICILIDSTEITICGFTASKLRDEHSVQTYITNLSPASYVMSIRRGVYRVPFSYFSSSSNSTKLISRVRELLSFYERPAIIIEYDAEATGPRTCYLDSVTCALAQLPQLTVLYSASRDETTNLLAHLMKIENIKGYCIPPINTASSHTEHLIKFYRSMPKVSPPTAILLALRYRSIADLATRSSDDIAKQTKVSKEQASLVVTHMSKIFNKNMLPPSYRL